MNTFSGNKTTFFIDAFGCYDAIMLHLTTRHNFRREERSQFLLDRCMMANVEDDLANRLLRNLSYTLWSDKLVSGDCKIS